MNQLNILALVQRIAEGGITPEMQRHLSKDELRMLMRILDEFRDKGSSPTLDYLWRDDFVEQPVSIDEFLEDDYYLGRIGRDLYPLWRRDLRVVLSPLNNKVEWIIKGSIGTGKTTIAVVTLLYKIYYLLCLKNPQKFYGLVEGSPIVFGLFNIFKYLAKSTSYGYLTTWMRDMSPFFKDQRPSKDRANSRKQETDSAVLDLPNNISIALGSTSIHALGQNVLGGLLDEAEFGKQKSLTNEELSQIADLYHAVRNRMNSRFMQAGGVMPGLLCLVSSARDTENFLSKHTEKKKDDPTVYLSAYALYEVKEVYKDSHRFKVVVGDKFHRSFIVQPGEAIPDGSRVIDVPVEYRATFEYDIDNAIRDIAGVETYGRKLFLPRRDLLLEGIEASRPRRHPFAHDEIELSIDDDIAIEDYFKKDEILSLYDKTHGLYRPKFFPHAERYVHVDLAKSRDCAGLAMGCISETKQIERFNAEGLKVVARDYVFFTDFMLRIRAAHGSEIDFAKIRRFIFFLLQTCHFPIRSVTYDSFQSTDSIQIFKKERMEAAEFSVDRKPGPYRAFRSIIMEKRLDSYYYDPFVDEVTKLEDHTDEGGKIDHPVKGSKDVSDSVCAWINGALVAKGAQITGTDADNMLTKAEKYAAAASINKPDLRTGDWIQVKPSTNPLEQFFRKR